VSFDKLLEQAASGRNDADLVSSLAARLASLDRKLTDEAVAGALAEIEGLGGQPVTPGAANSGRAQTRELVAQIAPGPLRPPPIVLGVTLAKRLGVATGSDIALSVQDKDGALTEVRFHVVGLLRTGTDAVDRSRALVELADLQHLTRIGAQVHELALRLADGADPARTLAALSAQPAISKLEVKGWRTLRPDVLAMVQANDALMGTLLFVALIVAAIGVVNTMMMAIFERRRELGVLKAVGMRPRSLLGLVLMETGLLAVAASLAGVGLGLLMDLYLMRVGLDLRHLVGSFSLAGVGLEPVLHGAITVEGVMVPVVSIVFAALLAAVFPAWSAARVEPAVGMREAS
jgi:ABC-type lipoprotein release transport system permease subunit